jgi:hypothetical protein
MSKRKTCGNCVHGDFNGGYPIGTCLVARILSNGLADIGIPQSIDQRQPIRYRKINALKSAAHCVSCEAKKKCEA